VVDQGELIKKKYKKQLGRERGCIIVADAQQYNVPTPKIHPGIYGNLVFFSAKM
jgi:hypothetical protein